MPSKICAADDPEKTLRKSHRILGWNSGKNEVGRCDFIAVRVDHSRAARAFNRGGAAVRKRGQHARTMTAQPLAD